MPRLEPSQKIVTDFIGVRKILFAGSEVIVAEQRPGSLAPTGESDHLARAAFVVI